MGKLRTNAAPGVSSLAKEIVKLWKDAVEESKRKRKRDEEKAGDKTEEPVKRVKGESAAAGSSAAASPAASTPGADAKPAKAGSGSPAPLSTIDTTLKTPRTSKSDGVATTLRASNADAATDSVRDKCVAMIYDSLALDSNASIKILTERAVAIENETFKLMNYQSGNDYRASESAVRRLILTRNQKFAPSSSTSRTRATLPCVTRLC